ncbi:hypothetical protein LCGC14_1820460 [marine sediment metagenome]|uniref:Uncharacterized protein n=1 Tax=marine sediment metagenome TaxID=412755 RepID=A0A0F9GJ41_9ZZZZ
MKAAERDKIAQETHQALLGIPGTEDKGLVGDVKEIKLHLEDHSYRLRTVEVRQDERNKPSKKAIAGYVSGAVAIVIALVKSFYNGG